MQFGYTIDALDFDTASTLRVGGSDDKRERAQAFTFESFPKAPFLHLTQVLDTSQLTFNATGANLTGSQGLTQDQLTFLTTRGATGKPAHLAIAAADVIDEPAEKKELTALRLLLTKLKLDAPGAGAEVKSLLQGQRQKLNVGYDSWQVSIVRVTDSTKADKTNTSRSGSANTRHVYGLIEGRNATGQHVWMRMDLVEDNSNTRYARIKNLSVVAKSTDNKAAKDAFMQLFPETGGIGTPHAINYHVCGALDRKQMIALMEAMITDQQRQYGEDTARIGYQFMGGSSGASAQASHNCLTWLKAHFKPYAHLKLPRTAFDWLVSNPGFIVSQATLFHRDSADVVHINMSDWLSEAAPDSAAGAATAAAAAALPTSSRR